MNILNRKGTFIVNREILLKYPNEFVKAMEYFVPLHVDVNLNYDTITYGGYSPLFNEIEEGQLLTRYELRFSEYDGEVSYGFYEIKDENS
jgi:hypothetical protein